MSRPCQCNRTSTSHKRILTASEHHCNYHCSSTGTKNTSQSSPLESGASHYCYVVTLCSGLGHNGHLRKALLNLSSPTVGRWHSVSEYGGTRLTVDRCIGALCKIGTVHSITVSTRKQRRLYCGRGLCVY